MEKGRMNKHICDMNIKKIEKYYGNPFINTKEDYYNEVIQKVLCSILLNKNIKKIDFLVFDLLVDYFVRLIKEFGNKCKAFSSLRGSLVVNYIDIKSCLKLHFPILYKEIYISKNYSLANSNIFLETENPKNTESISILHNSYLYYKHLCMRKNERSEGMNPGEFKNINYLYSKNHFPFDCSSTNENVNVLFLNEDTDFEKYKEIMKLKKKYMHDHMPVIPIHINMKEKKTGILEKIESGEEGSSSSSSSSSSSVKSDSSSSSGTHSSTSSVTSQGSKQSDKKNQVDYFSDDDISKEKIEILNLLPKLKEIYSQNSKRKKESLTNNNNNNNNPNTNDNKNFSFNSFNTFETMDDL